MKRVIVWDGETATRDSGWINPTSTCIIGSQTFESHSGKTAVQFKFKDSADWLGLGWDWAAFQVGPYGTEITAMKNFTSCLKVKGTSAGLSFNLLCNGVPAIDQPQYHTEKVIVAKYCPQWKDGEWHQIIVLMKNLVQPKDFDPKYLAEMQLFNTGVGDGCLFIDDPAFNDQNISK